MAAARAGVAGTVWGVSMVAAALARSGQLSSEGLACIVALEGFSEPAVLAHPLVVRPAARVLMPVSVPSPVSLLQRALALAPSQQVVQELLAMAPARAVVALADEMPSPQLVQALAEVAAEGSTTGAGDLDARWVLLRVGDRAVREDLVVALAGEVGVATFGSPWKVLTWLAAATSCPHLLAGLVDLVPVQVRPCVARFAGVAAGGGRPVDVFARELVQWGNSLGRAQTDWTAVAGGVMAPTWAYSVRCTGLEQVAAAAVVSAQVVDVWREVVRHPHLAGGRAYEQARGLLQQAVGGTGLPDAVVLDRAEVTMSSSPSAVISWLADGREHPDEVAFAWAALERMVKVAQRRNQPLSLAVGAVIAAELACVDAPGGRVAHAAAPLARELASYPMLNRGQRGSLVVLSQLAGVLHDGGDVAGLRVCDVCWTWRCLARPAWLEELIGSFFAGVRRVNDGVVVQALLDVGDTFGGTFADLVTVATALTA